MAVRNLLAISKLGEFKQWLYEQGIDHRPPRGDYQVLQIRLPGDTRWQAIYEREHAKVHLSVPPGLVELVMKFTSPDASPPVNEDSLKPTAEYAAETLPWV